MQTLIIITGTSGAGKTLQLEMLEQHYGQGRVLTIATRPQRIDKADDAYHFVSDKQLTEMESRGETIWVIGRYGSRYSITEQAIWEPIQNNKGIAFVAITPDYHVFLADWCKRNGVTPINAHLVAPHPDEQKRRLLQRDGEKFDPKRIQASAEFEADAREAATKTELHFIEQVGPQKMSMQLRGLIDSKHVPS